MAAELVKRLKLDPKVAEQTVEQLVVPGFGLAPDARFDMEGFRTVLALRAARDVEYADTNQLDDIHQMRPILQRWFDDGRPVFLVVEDPATSPWPDVVYEPADEGQHIYRVRPATR